ncbi:MAG: DUF2961 domain-containing protein [Caldilineaceae bacterium]|nr:DUF2961 domain-containing protein [Caldilineaceae bacterium]
MNLNLPTTPIPDRVSLTGPLPANTRTTYAQLDGPGCIQHIWVVLSRPERLPFASRKAIIRIYFDDEPIPYVEAPVGDFFGVMHGLGWYPIDTHFLSAKAWIGYNCYFPMPFARSVRIEFEAGPEDNRAYIQVDWHRYPGQTLEEPRRFCARWRREMPTQSYGEEYLMLDADGPGQLLGFVYGVRLLDDTDRWSHGGAENIYIDGEGEHPAFLRGIGGEDTFGAGYGGALHPPETHHYAAMPYYVHDDVSEARPAQRLVGYRFFEKDTLPFQNSIHMRFGCMANDICSTTYWYQESPVRPFFTMPDWPQLLPGVELPRATHDLALPQSGQWWLCGPFANHHGQAMQATLPPETAFDPDASYDGLHTAESAWLTEGSRQHGRDRARWTRRAAHHGFVDFNHLFRPWGRGVGKTDTGAALARCTLHAPTATAATLHLAWDDHLTLRLNDDHFDLGHHYAFRSHSLPVQLRAGANTIVLKLSNEHGSNHGGWAFAFRAQTADGTVLTPRADDDE